MPVHGEVIMNLLKYKTTLPSKEENYHLLIMLQQSCMKITVLIRPSKLGRILSCPRCVRTFVCQSVRKLIVSALYLSIYFHETWYKYKPSSDHVQRIRTDTPPTFYGIMPLGFFIKIVLAQ